MHGDQLLHQSKAPPARHCLPNEELNEMYPVSVAFLVDACNIMVLEIHVISMMYVCCKNIQVCTASLFIGSNAIDIDIEMYSI